MNNQSAIARAKIKSPLGHGTEESIVPVSVPALDDVRKFAAELHAQGRDWKGEAFGWEAEYSAERPEPPLDSKLTFTPADFCIGESGIWFFSMSWERGRDAKPIEFLDDRTLHGT